jgi:3-hydroxyisobutyrate dehydrogenase-like beta-hydroxyacid dehydrogenase
MATSATAKAATTKAAPAAAGKPAIGIVGLGIMGGIMAETLRGAGYAVCGHDIAPAARARLKKAGGKPLASAASVAQQSEVLIISLATSAALAKVASEIAAAPDSKAGKRALVIETSTLPLDDKLAAAALLKRAGHVVLDCPISGTAARMKDRAWTIFVSGDRKASKAVDPILRVFTDNLPQVGAFGNGTKMKYAANHLVAIYNVAYGEVVTLGRKMGLDVRQMLDLFGESPVLGTGVMRLRVPFMLDRKYTPPTMKVEVWQKDMQVIGDMAKSLGCPTPLFTACVPIYTAAMGQGLAQEDTASVAEVLGAMAGLPKR